MRFESHLAFCLVFSLLGIAHVTNGSRILLIFPMPSHSHYLLGARVAEALMDKGHEVTYITGIKKDPKTVNYTQVFLNGLEEKIHSQPNLFFDLEEMWPVQQIHLCYHFGYMISEFLLNHPGVLELVKSKKNYFDVVIMEQFYTESLAVISQQVNAPLIYFSTVIANMWTNHLVANPAPLAHVPNTFLDYKGHMDFTDRLHNWFLMVAEYAYRYFYAYPHQDKILHKVYPDAPSLNHLMYERGGFVFVNSHISINDAMPHVPNMIEIGGYHVKSGDKLPQDLKNLLDNAKHGVILFSLGSNVKSSHLPKAKLEHILKALGRVKQTVLWKWEQDTIEGKPSNVELRKWLPQQAILEHPNVKAFISHGGLLSTIETVTFGKPIVGIPFFGDQKMNINLAVSQGYALTVPYKELNEEKLFKAIDQIINNPSYTEEVRKRSALMRDRPVNPKDELVYWVEHIIKHRGAAHYRSKAMDMPWYKYEMIDVALVVGTSIVLPIVALLLVCKSLCCSRKSKKTSKNYKKD